MEKFEESSVARKRIYARIDYHLTQDRGKAMLEEAKYQVANDQDNDHGANEGGENKQKKRRAP